MRFVIAASLALAIAGCSNSNSSRLACPPYEVPATTDLTKPTVSFAHDVEPIFQTSCGTGGAACHGAPPRILPDGGTQQPAYMYLGSADGGVPASNIRASLVNTPSIDLPSMPLVTPGNASQSFLMHKMDGDQCQFDSKCVPQGQGCQTLMPQTNTEPLDVNTRDVVRRWIAQGAADN
jgi:hypothetical protein